MFLYYSTMISVQRVITTSKNLSCGWRANWLEIQTWSSSLCQLCCHRRSPWTHNGSSRSRKISRRLRRQHYLKTTKIFSLFNVYLTRVAFTEVRPTRVPMVISRALVHLHRGRRVFPLRNITFVYNIEFQCFDLVQYTARLIHRVPFFVSYHFLIPIFFFFFLLHVTYANRRVEKCEK